MRIGCSKPRQSLSSRLLQPLILELFGCEVNATTLYRLGLTSVLVQLAEAYCLTEPRARCEPAVGVSDGRYAQWPEARAPVPARPADHPGVKHSPSPVPMNNAPVIEPRRSFGASPLKKGHF